MTIQQNDRLQALYHLAVELSALRSLDSVLQTALDHCLTLTESQFGFVGLITPDGESMDVVATRGFHPASSFYEHFHLIPLRPNIFSHVVLHDKAIRSVDAKVDPRRVGQPSGHPPVHAFVGVPLRIRNRPIGMIGVANRPKPYADEHEQLLMTYAAQVAIVISNAQLYEELTAAKSDLEQKVENRTGELQDAKEALAQKATQLQKLLSETVDVQEKERQRIATGMHDGINQLLIGAMLELKSATQRLEQDKPTKAVESVRSVQEILHLIESELGNVIHDLRPPTLDALGLVPALRRYATRYEGFSAIPCQVNVLGEPCRLSARAEINLYRLVQEALKNIHTHAKATHAIISLNFSPSCLKVSIVDDGIGFDVEKVNDDGDAHLGILSMRERAAALGGQLHIHSENQAGTQLMLTIPLNKFTRPNHDSV